jgi:hypothetical protein
MSCFTLEPISKSPEEDDEASELDEAEEVLRVIFPAHKYAALSIQAKKRSTSHRRAYRLNRRPSCVGGGRYAVAAQLLIQWIAVVSAIADEVLWLGLDHVEVIPEQAERYA